MSEFGPESAAPGEGATGAPEQLSEEARQRFAAAAAAMQALKREEKKSKKRDDRVARTIIQFLSDEKYTHLFVLISRLVARDCPSIFILAILSLIHEDCQQVVHEYLAEAGSSMPADIMNQGMSLMQTSELDAEANRLLVEWITRMQMILSYETVSILTRLMLDEHNIDGTVLQLTTFVLQDFFRSARGGAKEIPFEKLHLLTASILQSIFEPFLSAIDKKLLQKPAVNQDDTDE
ncbi:MAG: hypothetical protein JWM56_198 [Candidatus Peribacteria bacterium]|nr:hypothetical protein [Candidatus Peribacteria bacterium]